MVGKAGTHRRGPYSVTIGEDGKILVKPGDWLSKYSLAIHNDLRHFDEYGRLGATGVIEPVVNVNRIFAGETLYHIPTHEAWQQMHSGGTETPPSRVKRATRLTEAEKQEIVVSMLAKDYNLVGGNLLILKKVLRSNNLLAHTTGSRLVIAVAAILSGGEFLAVVAEGNLIAYAALFPFQEFARFVDNIESGARAYAMRAVAYVTTAWAFNHPIPMHSPTILNRVKNTAGYDGSEVKRYTRAWQKAMAKTLQQLDKEASKRGSSKAALQLLLQAVGDGSPQKLCRSLLRRFEEKVRKMFPTFLEIWRSNYDVLYPK